jgi:archaellum component FlaC
MEKSTKKYWILALVIPFTMVGMFVAYMIISYAQRTSTGSAGNTVSSITPEIAKDSYYGGVYMDSVKLPSSNGSASVIKTAYISMSADDMDATVKSISDLELEYKAEATTSQDSGKGAARYISMTIKVEQAKFEEFYNALKALPGEFTYSSTGTSDVTETVEDLQARLDNLQTLETQLSSVLKQAKTVTDILAVQKELSTTRTQIEELQTQIKNLDNQTSYSYVSVMISQSSVGSQLSDDQWLPLGILKDAGRALVGFAKFLGTGLIYVVVFSPVIAAVVVPVIIIQKRAKK